MRPRRTPADMGRPGTRRTTATSPGSATTSRSGAADCLERERRYPDRADSFSADHVVPQSVDPSRAADYDNLLYVCCRCNSARPADPTLDPTVLALGNHVEVADDGTGQAKMIAGKDFVK